VPGFEPVQRGMKASFTIGHVSSTTAEKD